MTQPGPAPAPSDDRPRSGVFAVFLDFVERLGNLLPHPVTLFAVFALGVVLLSGIASWIGLSVEDIRPETQGQRIEAVSLMTAEGLRRISMNLVTNFTSFAPLGTVLVALLGVGVAERAGLLSAGIRALVLAAPPRLLTPTVVFAAVLSNTASEMGYVVLVPLAAVIYHSVGRHPFVGLAAAFAGVSGGYSANLFIGTVDPLLAGITTEAARIVGGDAYAPGGESEVLATANWYFMALSTVLITLVGTFVTEKIVAPRLGDYDESSAEEGALDASQDGLRPLDATEKRALGAAVLTTALLIVGLLLLVVPDGAPFRDPNAAVDATVVERIRPALKSVVALIFVFFIVPAIVYGRITGSMRNDRDVIDGMAKAMGSMGLYLVLVFFAAQFVAFFKWTNLGLILAVAGANFIESASLSGPIVFLPFILMCCFVNLMLGSASAQWAITAPIFVPMLMLSNYTPEV
ncbi:MAG: AbgT family transporter, partial [Planctomycetota bacterium]